HVSKTLQPIFKKSILNIPHYHSTPRNNIPFRHFTKHLLRNPNIPISHCTSQHGVPRDHIAAKGIFLKHPLGRISMTTLEIEVNQSVPDKHVASITELDHVRMNLNTQLVVYLDF
ncbi:hypothetical protein V8G54_034009, partial [Vigna mungo]